MLKRFCVFIFSLSFLFVGCGNALASIDTEIQTSQTILKYAASVSAGTKNGQIKVSYNISSRGVASSIQMDFWLIIQLKKQEHIHILEFQELPIMQWLHLQLL